MKKSGASQGQSASELISKRIAELGDWRGKTLSRMRKLMKEADPGKRGPAPELQQQMERIQRLPKAKQRLVTAMIDTVRANCVAT